jgi:hypothetical protein
MTGGNHDNVSHDNGPRRGFEPITLQYSVGVFVSEENCLNLIQSSIDFVLRGN